MDENVWWQDESDHSLEPVIDLSPLLIQSYADEHDTDVNLPSDVTDEQWEFLLPYLTLMTEDAPQREYSLRDAFECHPLCHSH